MRHNSLERLFVLWSVLSPVGAPFSKLVCFVPKVDLSTGYIRILHHSVISQVGHPVTSSLLDSLI